MSIKKLSPAQEHPQTWGLRFQPNDLQWDQGYSHMADILRLDYVFWRPHVIAEYGAIAKQINPNLKIVCTIDKWIEYREERNGTVVIDGPEEMVLRYPNREVEYLNGEKENLAYEPVILDRAFRYAVPNHNHEYPRSVCNFLWQKYVVQPLGDAFSVVDHFSHDWCNLDYPWGVDPPFEPTKTIQFRWDFLRFMYDMTGSKVFVNPGSAISNKIPENVSTFLEGMIMEGTELGGNLEQIWKGYEAAEKHGYDIFFVSRPENEEHVSPFRMIVPELCRALMFEMPFSISRGEAYEGVENDSIDFNLGVATGDRERMEDKDGNLYWRREFSKGVVYYSESENFIWANDQPLVPKLRSSKKGREYGSGFISLSDGSWDVNEHSLPATAKVGFDQITTTLEQSPFGKSLKDEWGSTRFTGPFKGSMSYTVGPAYNTEVTWGALTFQAHSRLVSSEDRSGEVMMPFDKAGYEIDSFAEGLWRPAKGRMTDTEESGRYKTVSFTVRPSVGERAIRVRHSRPMAKSWDFMRDENFFPFPVISLSHRFFGVEFDGYYPPPQVAVGAPFQKPDQFVYMRVLGGEPSPRHDGWRYVLEIPEISISEGFPARPVSMTMFSKGDIEVGDFELEPKTVLITR